MALTVCVRSHRGDDDDGETRHVAAATGRTPSHQASRERLGRPCPCRHSDLRSPKVRKVSRTVRVPVLSGSVASLALRMRSR